MEIIHVSKFIEMWEWGVSGEMEWSGDKVRKQMCRLDG